jgi:signal transduction histidine kinase
MLLDNVLEQHGEDDVLGGRLQNVRSAIERAYGDLRELTQGLSPVDLSEGSLTIALENLATRSPHVEVERGKADLDALLGDKDIDVLAHLYWIVKEATTNALAHAEADAIIIRASRDEEGLVLSVEDDGVGFVAENVEKKGWGLRTMQYRADLLGAEFDVASKPGRGTRVSCRLPV